jgi:nucleoside transporter
MGARPRYQLYARLAALQFLEFFVWGAWVVPISGYMNGALGFNGTQIGWICGAWALAAIVSPLFVGYVADRFFASEYILAALHAGGAACLLVAGFQTSFPALLAAVLMHALCFMPALPLADNLVFCSLGDSSLFSRVAIGGSVGWIAAGLTVGLLLGEGNGAFFRLAAAVEFVLAIYCLTLPHTPPRRASSAPRDVFGLGAWRLLAQPVFLVFVAVIPLIAISKSFYTVWTNAFLNEIGLPRPTALMTLAQASDIVVKSTLPWFIARIGLKNVLAAGMAAWVVRYLAFASMQTPAIVAGLLLHGFSYGFVVTGSSIYAARVSPPGMSARAQSLVTVLVFGIGTFLGAQVAGFTGEYYRGRVVPEWQAVAMHAGAGHDPGAIHLSYLEAPPSGLLAALREADTDHDGVVRRSDWQAMRRRRWPQIWILAATLAAAACTIFWVFGREPQAPPGTR